MQHHQPRAWIAVGKVGDHAGADDGVADGGGLQHQDAAWRRRQRTARAAKRRERDERRAERKVQSAKELRRARHGTCSSLAQLPQVLRRVLRAFSKTTIAAAH